MSNKTILTDKEFWEKEWENLDFPITLQKNIRADRSFMYLFDEYLTIDDKKSKKCIEIGCNPGKFLIYCSKYLNYEVHGTDYDEKGCLLTKKNLKAEGIDGKIKQNDIFNLSSDKKFDLVLSCGFIEHFAGKKLDEVLKKHVDLLEKNGRLFLSVPNFRYLNFLFTFFLRKDMLDHHNLEIMQKSFFVDFAKKNDLTVEYLGYFGGMHPAGIKLSSNNFFTKYINNSLLSRFERIQIFDRINSKYFSHHLGAVFVKK